MIKTAVIPAAGLGTRFKPFTNAYPKEMLPIINKPILSYLFCVQVKCCRKTIKMIK